MDAVMIAALAQLDAAMADLPDRDAPDAEWIAHFDKYDPGYTHSAVGKRLRVKQR